MPAPAARPWRVAGIDFAHMHMGDNLRMVHEHPNAEIVGVSDEDDPARMADAAREFGIPPERVFEDHAKCLEESRPDVVILCPPTASHAEMVERIAPFGVHLMVEKPFASSLAEADRMVRAVEASGQRLAINWPLAWHRSHRTAKRLVDEGVIGDLVGLNYYDGNRGPLFHVADKRETSAAFRTEEKAKSWFYKRAAGGGSLLDYLGYGVTLGTWFLGGRAPRDVTAVVDEPPGLEVDVHSITIARYDFGLCRFETRWGTFTDPWTHQPQPECGFVLVGTDGTLASHDYAETVRVQTREHPEGHVVPADVLAPPAQNPVQYLLHCLAEDLPVEGPLSPELCRVGQQIVDSAMLSIQDGRTVPLQTD